MIFARERGHVALAEGLLEADRGGFGPGQDVAHVLGGVVPDLVGDAARVCLSAMPKESEGEVDAARTQAKGLVQEVFVNAERMAADLESDVLWLSEGRVLAGMNVNIWDVTEPITTLITSGTTIDRQALGDPSVPLNEHIAR